MSINWRAMALATNCDRPRFPIRLLASATMGCGTLAEILSKGPGTDWSLDFELGCFIDLLVTRRRVLGKEWVSRFCSFALGAHSLSGPAINNCRIKSPAHRQRGRVFLTRVTPR